MLLFSNIILLLINAITSRREFTLFTRVAVILLLYFFINLMDNTEIGINDGLFHSITTTHIFDAILLFIPAKVYSTADTCKTSALKENNGKSGIYR